jgi:hypothetical protein
LKNTGLTISAENASIINQAKLDGALSKNEEDKKKVANGKEKENEKSSFIDMIMALLSAFGIIDKKEKEPAKTEEVAAANGKDKPAKPTEEPQNKVAELNPDVLKLATAEGKLQNKSGASIDSSSTVAYAGAANKQQGAATR